MKALARDSKPLAAKGVGVVLEFRGVRRRVRGLPDLKEVADELVRSALGGGVGLSFESNESIGTRYMLYRFRVLKGGGRVASCRLVVQDQELLFATLVVDKKFVNLLRTRGVLKNSGAPEGRAPKPRGLPPGQRWIPSLVIYRALGQPSVSLDDWRLVITGDVRREVRLSYPDLISQGLKKVVADFHCVTGWSVRRVEWEGVPLAKLASLAEPLSNAGWLLVSCLDGYSTVVPTKDALNEDSIIAVRLNGRDLPPEHGWPARLLIPTLYGWKSAKWVSVLRFSSSYADGYWEALGYHERGSPVLEERFKGSGGVGFDE